MTEQDDILIRQFFEEHTQEVADHGFSKRVMRHLPGRAWRLNNIWTIVCAVLGLVFFVLVRGWEVLGNALAVWLHTAPAQDVFQLNTLTIVLSVLMLMALGTYQLVSKELRR